MLERIEQKESRERLRHGLKSLTVRQCVLLFRIAVRGETYAAIAREEGVSEAAVRKRARKAMLIISKPRIWGVRIDCFRRLKYEGTSIHSQKESGIGQEEEKHGTDSRSQTNSGECHFDEDERATAEQNRESQRRPLHACCAGGACPVHRLL